ncbi:hypothetical protein [Serinicoccus sp. CUA-874]|uniref:hypothetical protein n=1 Tax=Serinicoccus sp. CUA-874 TaxID=1517939 RepID=UPI00117A5279|nr:hypothetical protein [Serinicoccus sp. CUA-874]
MLISTLTAAAGSFALYVFYGAFSHRWPTNYSQIKSELDAHHRRGIVRFLGVRLGPVVLVAASVAHVARTLEGDPLLAALFLALAHVALTDGRALMRARPMPPRRFLYHFGAIVAVIIASIVGAIGGLAYPSVFPQMQELKAAIWTAAITAILGAAYLRMSSQRDNSEESDLEWIRDDIGADVWDQIPEVALTAHADPQLVQAVVAAEVMQRPRWLRNIETRWPGARTFGVAQMASDKRLTDIESVELLSRNLAGVQVDTEYGYFQSTPVLEGRLELHNENPAFISDCLKFLRDLKRVDGRGSEVVGADGLPAIVVCRVKRAGQELLVTGTYCWDADRIDVASSVGYEALASVEIPEGRARRPWSFTTRLDVDDVTISAAPSPGAGETPSVEVSLREYSRLR